MHQIRLWSHSAPSAPYPDLRGLLLREGEGSRKGRGKGKGKREGRDMGGENGKEGERKEEGRGRR